MNKATLPVVIHKQIQQVQHTASGLLGVSSESWTAIGSWALVAVGFLTICAAIGAAWLAYKAATAQLGETQALRRERAQPYVVVYLEQSSNSTPTSIDLVVKNLGATAATNVAVKFDQSPTSVALTNSPDPQAGEFAAIEIPDLPVLVPGQLWRTFWDTTHARMAVLKDIEPWEDKYEVEVSFSDSRHRPMPETYRYVLDWKTIYARTFIDVGGISDIANATKKIGDALRSVTSGGAVTVESFNGEAHQKRAKRNTRRRLRRWRVAGNTDDDPTRLDHALVGIAKRWERFKSRLGY